MARNCIFILLLVIVISCNSDLQKKVDVKICTKSFEHVEVDCYYSTLTLENRNKRSFYSYLNKKNRRDAIKSMELKPGLNHDSLNIGKHRLPYNFQISKTKRMIRVGSNEVKITKLISQTKGLEDFTSIHYYLPSGRPIVSFYYSMNEYTTYESGKEDRQIIKALETNSSCLLPCEKRIHRLPIESIQP